MLLVSFRTVKAVLSQPGDWPMWYALLGDRYRLGELVSGIAPPRRRTNVSKHAALLLGWETVRKMDHAFGLIWRDCERWRLLNASTLSSKMMPLRSVRNGHHSSVM